MRDRIVNDVARRKRGFVEEGMHLRHHSFSGAGSFDDGGGAAQGLLHNNYPSISETMYM
jgi:hypothetical protein